MAAIRTAIRVDAECSETVTVVAIMCGKDEHSITSVIDLLEFAYAAAKKRNLEFAMLCRSRTGLSQRTPCVWIFGRRYWEDSKSVLRASGHPAALSIANSFEEMRRALRQGREAAGGDRRACV